MFRFNNQVLDIFIVSGAHWLYYKIDVLKATIKSLKAVVQQYSILIHSAYKISAEVLPKELEITVPLLPNVVRMPRLWPVVFVSTSST